MPLYKGTAEVASGNLYKADTNIENGYKESTSFYINEVTISFLNFPGVSDYSITGGPGETIPGNRYQQWTASASSGYAFNGTQTAVGLPTDFTFTAGAQGSTSNTTTSPRISYAPSVFPTSSVSVDYNSLSISLPQSQVVTLSYTFSGNLGRSTSCTTFAGSSCGVSSSSQFAGNFQYWTSSASGTGGYGANSCYQGCSVSISSSGGSSSCNMSGGTSSQSASIQMACNIVSPQGGVWGNYYCATISAGSASSICGGYSIETKQAIGSFSGGGIASSSCSGTPTFYNSGNYRLIGYGGTSSTFDDDRGTWESRVRAGNGTVVASASCTVN